MKNKILVGLMTIGLLSSTTSVYAMGNATVSFNSDDTVTVGDTFTVKMNVEDIKDTYDGVVSMGGNLSFDNTKIEYISSKGIDTPYQFQINEDYNYKIAGLDFTLENGIKDNLTVYEFTFKALQEGTTTITLTNAKLTDSNDYIATNVVTKKVDIIQKNKNEELKNIEIPVINTESIKNEKEIKVEPENEINLNAEKENTEILKQEEVESKKEEKNTIVSHQVTTQKEKSLIEKITESVTNFFQQILNLFK